MSDIVKHINFCKKRDEELFVKLNAVAPCARRKVADLARFLLLESLDKLITENKIKIDYNQPAGVAG